MKHAAFFSLLVALTVLVSGAAAFERTDVVIRSRTGTHRFHAEVAVTKVDRERGLMGRKSLAPDAGMLFVFEDDRVATMWMHDTPLSLDMLFLAADGVIVSIAARTTPLSDAVISSILPARGVLEVPAGTAAKLGIVPGDRVTSPPLADKPAPRAPKP